MEIGTKVRLRPGEGPLMTVKRVTPQGYVVCAWSDGFARERMFFPEALVTEHAAPLEPPPPEVPSTQDSMTALELPPEKGTAESASEPRTDDGSNRKPS